MNNLDVKPRLQWVDTAKGICILLVVYSHVYMGDHPTFIHFQDYFRMPLYFLLSGLFFKTYDSFQSFIIKKTNKLLIPFIFAYVVISIPVTFYINHRIGLPVTFPNDFWEIERWRLLCKGNATLWFLFCLFVLNVSFYAIFSICSRKIWALVLCCTFIGMVSFHLESHGIYIPMWGDAALTALPFFLFGYLLRHYSKILYEPFGRKHWIVLVCSFAALIAIYLYNSKCMSLGVELIHGDNHFTVDSLSMYIGGLCGTLFILMLAKRFNHIPFVSYIGRYSIVVLITHFVMIYFMRVLLYHFPFDTTYLHAIMFGIFLMVVLLEIPTIRFCIKYLPHVFAQKDLI